MIGRNSSWLRLFAILGLFSLLPADLAGCRSSLANDPGSPSTLSLSLVNGNQGNESSGGLMGLYPWPENRVNLVKNPSFEEIDGSGQAVGWRGHQAFSPTTDVFRSGSRSMRLKDSHIDKYTPLATQPLDLKPGFYSLRGWMKAENAGTNNPNAGGRISVWMGKNWVSSPVIRGTTDWTQIERKNFPILPGESATLRLEAYGKPNGTIYFDDIELRRLIPPIVEGFLLSPNYRGVLFGDRPQIIRVSVTVHPEEADLRITDLMVRLSLFKEGKNSPILSVEEKPTESKAQSAEGKAQGPKGPTPYTLHPTPFTLHPSPLSFIMSLDASTVPPGAYTLRLQAFKQESAQGKEQNVSPVTPYTLRPTPIFEYPPYRIVKLPAKARKELNVYVDHDNVLVLNGQRRFVLGIYDTAGYSNSPSSYEPRISKIAQAPINLYLNYWLGAAPVSALNALMTTLQKYGMAYLHTSNIWYQDSRGWPAKLPCNGVPAGMSGQDGFTACMASELSTNAGLAGWYTADEEPASQAERVFHQYSILRENDPGGVTFIAQTTPRELVRWRDATDVMGVDPYPIYNVPADKTAPLEIVTQWVEQAQSAVEKSRPVWAVIQFFQFGSKGHWPTYDELRTMSYMAIIAGAKGLFYWSYGAKGLSWVKDSQQREELWQRLVRVTKEIKSLERALLSPDAPEILASQSPTATIRLLAKRVGNTRYFIAVNNTSKEVQGDFTLSQPGESVQVIGEGRTAQLSGKSRLTDRFAPYATHVYVIGGLKDR